MDKENDFIKTGKTSSSHKLKSPNLALRSIRFFNFVLDSLLCLIICAVFYLASYLIGFQEFVENNPFVLSSLVYWSYYTAFEGLLQRSPAKFITKTIVVNWDGTKPKFGTICIRSLSRLIPFEEITFLRKNQWGLHDLISKTSVIHKF